MRKIIHELKLKYREKESIVHFLSFIVLVAVGVLYADYAVKLVNEYWYIPLGIAYLIYQLYVLEKEYLFRLRLSEHIKITNNADFLWNEFVQKLLHAQQEVLNVPNFAIDNFVIDESVFYNKYVYDFVIRKANNSYMLEKNMKDALFSTMKIDLKTLIKQFQMFNTGVSLKFNGVDSIHLLALEESGSKLRVRILLIEDDKSFEQYMRLKKYKRSEIEYQDNITDASDKEF